MTDSLVQLDEVVIVTLDTSTDATVIVAATNVGAGSGGGGAGGHTIQDEGINLTARSKLNFVGSSVTVTDDSGNDATVVTLASSGAPTTADYLVGTANGSLSAEIVVGTSPGGELGGTWASPTVDTTHSGSSHASVQAAAEATAAAALSAHAAAADPHPTYLTAAEGAAAYDAIGAATSAVATHEADTTSVHGITDTSTLYRSGGTDVAVTDGGTGSSTAAGARTNLGLVIGTDVLAFAHEADTTNVHGITDTSVLETTSGAQAKADAKVSDTAYDATSWDGVTSVAPSKNAVRDKIETVATSVSDHLADTSDAHDASAVSVVDSGGYWTGTDVESVLQEAGAANALTNLMADTLAGMTVPVNSLDRWKAGPGLPGTPQNGAIASTSSTTLTPTDSSILPNSSHRLLRIDDEEIYTTAGETTTTVTMVRGVNGTTAATHDDKAPIVRDKVRTVLHLGDSVTEGVTTSTTVAGDGWSVRAARVVAKVLGGEQAQWWPMWRNTGTAQVHQEFALTGSSLAGVAAYDVGYFGGVIFTGSSSNGFVWTRPAGLNVQCVDIYWVDYSSTAYDWQYSLDGGTTWVANPITSTAWSSGQGILRRSRINCDNPTTVRVRAYNGTTNRTIVLPYVPLKTWSSVPAFGTTEGVAWGNLGIAGGKLRTALNSRTFTDAVVTNGSATVTSATATFVANDAGSTVYLQGVAYTISTRDSATQITLTGNYTGTTGTGKRITVFQGDGTTDRMAMFRGHPGSDFPDLVIVGPWDNDMGTAPTSNGDTNPDAMTDMLTYLVGKIQGISDVLLIAPHENNSFNTTLQSQYRTAIAAVGAATGCAVLNLYDAFAAYGYTGYTAVNAAGFMADSVHLSALGNRWMGAHLARVLRMV